MESAMMDTAFASAAIYAEREKKGRYGVVEKVCI